MTRSVSSLAGASAEQRNMDAVIDCIEVPLTEQVIEQNGTRVLVVSPADADGTLAPSTCLAQLRERIAKTVVFLKTLDSKKIDAVSDKEIVFPLGPEKKGHMKGDDYLNHFVLPNFYFHCTAAYTILRHLGVEVGKQDFLGQIPIKVV